MIRNNRNYGRQRRQYNESMVNDDRTVEQILNDYEDELLEMNRIIQSLSIKVGKLNNYRYYIEDAIDRMNNE
jgi:hypothetical protein